ncbi:hypothetical protein ACFX11_037979 [Malus domestica]
MDQLVGNVVSGMEHKVCKLVKSRPGLPPHPGLDFAVARYYPFWAPTTPSRFLFLRTHTRTSQWVIHHGIALAQTRLTSEFRWNPKPVSSQKASCQVKMGIYIQGLQDPLPWAMWDVT